ncbi:hypothetical protein [Legionella tunisiensis]|uniref:hypothetical protein n=1 Tax=Legionella tunisiensis TaxID=1034944 RepID=UPI0002FFDAAA|nr:hypothetical protein [Legionella tunisiensis]
MPFDQLPNPPTDDAPPAYDSLIKTPQDIAAKREFVRAENEVLTQEIILLQQEIRRLKQERDEQKTY